MAHPDLSTRPPSLAGPRHAHLAAHSVPAILGLALGAIATSDALNPQWSPIEHMVSFFVHGRASWLIPFAATGFALAAASVGSASTVAGFTERVLLAADVGWLVRAAVGLRRMTREG